MKKINQIYNRYFQKSKVFLYPLLNFRKKDYAVKTYLAWAGYYTPADRKLICVYDASLAKDIKFQRLVMSHPLVEASYFFENECVLVFDMSEYFQTWDFFLEGKYSKMQLENKHKIIDFFGVNTPEGPLIQSFLFPEQYYKQYAELLDVDVNLLEEVGELCEIYNLEHETYTNIIP